MDKRVVDWTLEQTPTKRPRASSASSYRSPSPVDHLSVDFDNPTRRSLRNKSLAEQLEIVADDDEAFANKLDAVRAEAQSILQGRFGILDDGDRTDFLRDLRRAVATAGNQTLIESVETLIKNYEGDKERFRDEVDRAVGLA